MRKLLHLARAFAAIGIMTLHLATPAGAAPPSAPPARPTIVLVHGAFAESSSWNHVVRKLRARSFSVIAVANPLRGVKPDAAYVAAIVAPVKGPGPTLAPSVLLPDGTRDLYIRQDKFTYQFAADVPPAVAYLMAVSQRPITESALGEGAPAAAWKTVPSWFIYGDRDKNIPPAALAFMAERAKSMKTVVVKGGSHVVMMSKPNPVTRLIVEAAYANTAQPRGLQETAS